MKLFRFSLVVLFSISIFSCSVNKQLKQLNLDAQSAYQAYDFEAAIIAYDEIIKIKTEKNKEVEGNIYQNAGLAAWEVKKTTKTIDYLEKAKQTSAANAKTYSTLAKAYLEIDNLSREINNLEDYVEKYPKGEELTQVHAQLFLAYAKSSNWEKADKLWSSLDIKYHSEVRMLSEYMKVNGGLGKEDKVNKLAYQLLNLDRNNTNALEVLALYYYRTAEERYQNEMKAYEDNRTNRQYKQLLDALEEINTNFRTSRDYLERLYKYNPDPRFAIYLGNIYTRFDNKKQADYYYRIAKEK
jgi:hypothetical protein